MKQRSISAIGVVVVGLVPAIIGGPIWAIALAIICLMGFREYRGLATHVSPRVPAAGYLLVPSFAAATYFDRPERAVVGISALAIAVPLVEATTRKDISGSFAEVALAAGGTLYLGIPLYAGIELRTLPGDVNRAWLTDLSEWVALDWNAYPRGLAWLVAVILCTWLSDTFAYLVGRRIGKRKLSPVVSPNKTVEGLAGGVVAAALTGALAFWAFGLSDKFWLGLLFGAAMAIVGLFGDLAESVLKREAAVKDSGHLIPGHGGILDRIDALLFTFVAGWYLAILVDDYLL